MPLLTDFSSPSPTTRAHALHWRLWAPLALTLAASAAWAQDAAPQDITAAAAPEPDYALEAKTAESSGLVVHVAPLQQTQFIVENAERVRVQAPAVVEVSLGEPNQLAVQGLSQGVSEVLVWRQGIKKPLSVRVEVVK